VSFQCSQQCSNDLNCSASVEQPSGIWAGAGGFDLQVAGHTDLKGAALVASAEAIQNNRNRLVTQTLTAGRIGTSCRFCTACLAISRF